MKSEVELSGSISKVRKALEDLGRRDARVAGRRALAGAGSVACLVAAYGWGALALPALVPVRIGLAILLTFCTVAAIRLAPGDFDPAIIAHLNRLLYGLRQTPSLGEVRLETDLASTVAQRRLVLGLKGPMPGFEGFLRAAHVLPHAELVSCTLEGDLLKVAFESSSGQGDGSEVASWVDWFLDRWREGTS